MIPRFDQSSAAELAQLCLKAEVENAAMHDPHPADSLRAKRARGKPAPEPVGRQIERTQEYLAEPPTTENRK